jgi:hypothetical protein
VGGWVLFKVDSGGDRDWQRGSCDGNSEQQLDGLMERIEMELQAVKLGARWWEMTGSTPAVSDGERLLGAAMSLRSSGAVKGSLQRRYELQMGHGYGAASINGKDGDYGFLFWDGWARVGNWAGARDDEESGGEN